MNFRRDTSDQFNSKSLQEKKFRPRLKGTSQLKDEGDDVKSPDFDQDCVFSSCYFSNNKKRTASRKPSNIYSK